MKNGVAEGVASDSHDTTGRALFFLRMIFLSGSKVLSITFDSNFTIADFDYFCKVNSITKTVLNYTKALENK